MCHENVFMALSNIPIIPALLLTYQHDNITFIALLFVGIASSISHLVENHKHCMKGIGCSVRTSYVWNRLDVLGCVMVLARMLYLIYVNCTAFTTAIAMLFILLVPIYACNIISEYDKYNPQRKRQYILFHSLWHAMIYIWLYGFLKLNFIFT